MSSFLTAKKITATAAFCTPILCPESTYAIKLRTSTPPQRKTLLEDLGNQQHQQKQIHGAIATLEHPKSVLNLELSTFPAPDDSVLNEEYLKSVLQKLEATQSIDHLQPFYEATVKRFIELQKKHGSDNVKISFIILDWDDTLHSKLIHGQNADEMVSDILKKVMTEKKITTTAANGQQKNLTIVPFPLIVTCHSVFLNMMLDKVRTKQKMPKTADLVLGTEEESKTLVELELFDEDGLSYYRMKENGLMGKFDDLKYKADSYTLPELLDQLKIDGVIQVDSLSEEDLEVSRIRAYALEDNNHWLGTSVNNKLRKLSEWTTKYRCSPRKLSPPRNLRFEVPEKLNRVNIDGSKDSLTPVTRLNQIPFISVDRDLYYGYFLTENSNVSKQFLSTPIEEPDEDFLEDQSLEFKTEMYRKAFSGLVGELKRYVKPNLDLDMSNVFWDIISIGNHQRDHLAVEGILELYDLGLFTQGVNPEGNKEYIRKKFSTWTEYAYFNAGKPKGFRNLSKNLGARECSRTDKIISIPSIKSYYIEQPEDSWSFIGHLKRMSRDLDLLRDCDKSLTVTREKKEPQSIDHLQPFYEATVKRFIELQKRHVQDAHIDVKLSFIILDWDNTLHSKSLKANDDGNPDDLIRDILLKVMSERMLTIKTEDTETQKELIIVPFPIIITCHKRFFHMMLKRVREEQELLETANLVMGTENDATKLLELKLEGGYYVVEDIHPDLDRDGKLKDISAYNPNAYTLMTLINDLKNDGLIDISKNQNLQKLDFDRLRVYDSDEKSLGTTWTGLNDPTLKRFAGTKEEDNTRYLNKWYNWQTEHEFTPQKLIFEIPQKVDRVKLSGESSRLNQIPSISIDIDFYNHTDHRSLIFKSEMYKRSFTGLVEELRRQGGQKDRDLSRLFWDIISIGDQPQDHIAVNDILELSDYGFFAQGVHAQAEPNFIAHKFPDGHQEYQYSESSSVDIPSKFHDLKLAVPIESTKGIDEAVKSHIAAAVTKSSVAIPSIKSYQINHEVQDQPSKSFTRHLERMTKDLEILMNYDGSLLLTRDES